MNKLPVGEDFCWDDIDNAPLSRVIMGYQHDKPHLTYHMQWWEPSQRWVLVTPRTGEFKVVFDWMPEPDMWMEVARPRFAGCAKDQEPIVDAPEGQTIMVRVDGVEYPSVIINGVQRFVEQHHPLKDQIPIITDRASGRQVEDLNSARIRFLRGEWPKRDYMEYHMALGYSVCGFCDVFTDVDVENPLW